ncbi:MAG: bifunctional riboflavin kinase/FAD synthetase [Armatimonadetes bacterium]|nr:bifunctional riboflavin kinase/FAD synthetase [Armatimonadota bacterium]
MRVVFGLEAFQRAGRPVCVALGSFDGVHRGHRAVIDTLLSVARQVQGEGVVTTFDPHPLTVIAAPAEPFLLTTVDERLRLFAAFGVDAAMVIRFDAAMRSLSGSAWLEALRRHLDPVQIVVSSTHTFGLNREGTVAFLRAWASAHGIQVTVVPLLTNEGFTISSSSIRERLRQGDVRTAAEWLGRWYGVEGTVIQGEGRGRQLGLPTANLRVPQEKLIPGQGVYAAYATTGGVTYPAAVNIGIRPTFGGTAPVVEAHLIEAAVDLYGRALELAFVQRLRAEMRFPGPEALKKQVMADISEAKAVLQDQPMRT